MGRIRTIKPEFFLHEGLFDLEQETGMPIRIAYAGIWTCCDREGRFQWRPRQLKTQVLPYDNIDFSRVLDALVTSGFIVKYSVGADVYGCIPSWKDHQFINNKEPHSTIPPIQETQQNDSHDACGTRESHVNDACDTRGVKEGKGKEGELERKCASETRGNSLPDSVDTRILCERIGIFRIREQEEMHRCFSVYCRDSGKSTDVAMEHMVARWEEFKASAPQMDWQWGSAHGFFMSGKWDDPRAWPRGKVASSVASVGSNMRFDSPEQKAAKDREAYAMWQSMSKSFRQANPWEGPVPA